MIEITWLGHATFQLRLESGEVILMDPWVEGNPKFPAGHQFQRVDALLISHPHQDHIHGCIELSKKFKPKVIALFETALWLGSKGVENLSGMGKGGTQEVVAGVKATMTHAVHSAGIMDGNQVIYGGEPAGYVLTFPDGRSAATTPQRPGARKSLLIPMPKAVAPMRRAWDQSARTAP